MKLLVILSIVLFGSFTISFAQMKEGKIVFERVMNMRRNITDPQMRAMIPESRTDKFELLFNQQSSLFKSIIEEEAPDPFANNGGDRGGPRMMFRMPSTTTYTDLKTQMQYEARSFFEKDFLVIDSVRQISWKISEETKMIAKHLCKKATTTSAGQMMRMNFGGPPPGSPKKDSTQVRVDNKPKDIEVVVWYAEDIPVSVGPESFSGLPGAILEVNSDNGASITTAVEISGKYSKKELAKPTVGEVMTRAQFADNMRKIMEDMQRNGPVRFNRSN
jgi:GLPGLI family protein